MWGSSEQLPAKAQLAEEPYERVLAYQEALISFVAGGDLGGIDYAEMRRELLQDPRFSDLAPGFLRKIRDTGALWGFAKSIDGSWEPRRQFIREEFAPLLDRLEGGVALISSAVQSGLAKLDASHVQALWAKAMQRCSGDSEGAITASKALLESVCKLILDSEDGPGHGEHDDLPKLYKAASERLNLAPSQHSEVAFKRILGGCSSVVDGMATLRNRLGDAHGPGRKPVKPQPRHASLAVNLAGSMALFLVETYAALGSSQVEKSRASKRDAES
jgi:hypothetical protein